MRRTLFWLAFPAGMVLWMATTTAKDDYFEMSKQLEIMQSAFRELNLFYVDELAPGELMETGIKAMLAQLDPYTRYFPESKMEDVRFMQTGEYGGVGASIETRNDRTTIVNLLEGEPAAEAGLRLGDVLMEVDGRSLSGLDTDQIGDLLQGATGTEVTVVVAPARVRRRHVLHVGAAQGEGAGRAVPRHADGQDGVFGLELVHQNREHECPQSPAQPHRFTGG
jgi:carboxyl-terminal processing protease